MGVAVASVGVSAEAQAVSSGGNLIHRGIGVLPASFPARNSWYAAGHNGIPRTQVSSLGIKSEGFAPINEILAICEEKSFEGPILLELLNEDFALKSL